MAVNKKLTSPASPSVSLEEMQSDPTILAFEKNVARFLSFIDNDTSVDYDCTPPQIIFNESPCKFDNLVMAAAAQGLARRRNHAIEIRWLSS